MFGRILMTLGLAMLLAAPAHAGFGLVLPDSPIVDDPEKTSLNLVICAIDPATGAGIPIERPQVFTALRYSGDNMDRSEHLSVLDEVVAYGARAWTTNISLPHPGVYQLVMQTKAGSPNRTSSSSTSPRCRSRPTGPPKAGTSPPTSALRSRP